MAKSKLGIYIIGLDSLDAVNWFAKAQPHIAVSMDHNPEKWRAIKQVSPGTFILGRYYVEDSQQKFDDPERDAERFFARMKPDAEKMRGIYNAWMGYNESQVWNGDDADRLSRFYSRFGDLLRADGLKSGAYSFSQGHPGQNEVDLKALWGRLAAGLIHCDYLVLHEYDAPDMWRTARERCLRYRRVLEALPAAARRPIIIGECGIDGGALDDAHAQQGWKKFATELQYLASLRWYDSELEKDNYVMGAAIFSADAWGKDGSFGIAGASMIRDYMGAGGTANPTDDGLETALQLIKRFEGFAPVPVRDVNGSTIIGYGHTIGRGEKFTSVTEAEAEALLRQDIQRYAQVVRDNVKVELTALQFAALVDFAYNVGVGSLVKQAGFLGSDLLVKLNQGLYREASNEFLRWVFAKGKVLPGLVRRRCAESKLFLGEN